MPKTIFVSFLRPPVGTTYFVEGLRAASGFVRGESPHKVTVAFLGKGVMCAVKGVDRSYAVKFLEFFPTTEGKRFYVEEESLKNEQIDPGRVAEEFAVASRKELAKMMLDSDFCISF